jgi:ankyrin repeat protein
MNDNNTAHLKKTGSHVRTSAIKICFSISFGVFLGCCFSLLLIYTGSPSLASLIWSSHAAQLIFFFLAIASVISSVYMLIYIWIPQYRCEIMHKSALKGDKARLESVLPNISLDIIDRKELDGEHNYQTALHQAVKAGHAECVTALLGAGADPNHPNDFGNTALLYAAFWGNAKCVTALLRAGADPNVKARADKDGNPDVKIRFYRWNKNLRGDNYTALHYAAKQGHAECVQALLETNANPNVQNREGHTALHYAAKQRHIPCMKALLPYMLPEAISANSHFPGTALHMLLWSEAEARSVKTLLEAGADPNVQNCEGHTALHYATQLGHAAYVKALLEAGADPNIKSKGGHTALISAAYCGVSRSDATAHGEAMQRADEEAMDYRDIALLLICANANATITDSSQKTAAGHFIDTQQDHPMRPYIQSADHIQQSIASLRQTLQAPESIEPKIPCNLTVAPTSIKLTDSITFKSEPGQTPCLAIKNDDPTGLDLELKIPLQLLPNDLLYLLATAVLAPEPEPELALEPIQFSIEPDGIMVRLFEQDKTPLERLLKKLNRQHQQNLKKAYMEKWRGYLHKYTLLYLYDPRYSARHAAFFKSSILLSEIGGVPLETSPQRFQFLTPHAEGFFQEMSMPHTDRSSLAPSIVESNDFTEDTEPQAPSIIFNHELPIEAQQRIFDFLSFKDILACFMTGGQVFRPFSPVRLIQSHQLMPLRPPCRLPDHRPGVADTQLEAQQYDAAP